MRASRCLALFAAACLVLGHAQFAVADTWPSKPLRLIVPFPPGGAADTVGRIYAEKLGEALKQPVVVENKAGAGTAIAAEAAAKAAPDGYTLSLAPAGQLTILPHLNTSIPYDPFKDFAPVSLLASVPYVVGAAAETPVSSLPDLIVKAKAEPGKLTYSSCGTGTLCHLSGELFKSLTGTDLLHVPFKGSAPAVQALLSGQVDLAFDTLTVLAPQVKGGKVKGLAITSPMRSLLLPDVPTAREAGLPKFVVSSWFGLVVPAATPKNIVARLHQEIAYIAALPAVRERLNAQGLDAIASTPEEFTRTIAEDYERWGAVVQASGAKLD
ncbi:MAG: tripartite tricarboxylate transporter substrate binding protein [Methylacidiphilales bacterium]|nr:tripartite tricarboxylate transporter substrate binding protein [Candidatus Methylacidiphilales bacterium]